MGSTDPSPSQDVNIRVEDRAHAEGTVPVREVPAEPRPADRGVLASLDRWSRRLVMLAVAALAIRAALGARLDTGAAT